MRLKLLLPLLSVLAITTIELNTALSSSNGKAVKTGAPGEGTCRDCHNSNPLNSPGGSVSISSPDISNNEYVGGQTYQIDVTIERSGVNEFGFGFEALKPNGTNAGTLMDINTTETHVLTGNISGNIRNTMTHKTNSGISSNTKTYSFNWLAPEAGTGNVTLYATGNAVNQNGNASGDYVYSTSLALTESNPSSIEAFNRVNVGLHTYPNPVVEKLNIEFNAPENGVYHLQLLSLNSGNLIYGQDLSCIKGENKLSLNNSDWSQGLYLLKIGYKGKSVTKKIIVQ